MTLAEFRKLNPDIFVSAAQENSYNHLLEIFEQEPKLIQKEILGNAIIIVYPDIVFAIELNGHIHS